MYSFPRVPTKKSLQMWQLKIVEIYPFTVLEDRIVKSECWQGRDPYRASREESFLAAFSFWRLLQRFLGLPQYDTGTTSAPAFNGLLLCLYVSFIFSGKTFIIASRAYPNSEWLHLEISTLIVAAKTFIANKVTFCSVDIFEDGGE